MNATCSSAKNGCNDNVSIMLPTESNAAQP